MDPVFHNWENAPKYGTISLAKLLREMNPVIINVYGLLMAKMLVMMTNYQVLLHHYKLITLMQKNGFFFDAMGFKCKSNRYSTVTICSGRATH